MNSKEREIAERAYLKKYATSWVNAGGMPGKGEKSVLKPEFIEAHPRYEELVKGLFIMHNSLKLSRFLDKSGCCDHSCLQLENETSRFAKFNLNKATVKFLEYLRIFTFDTL